MLHREGRHRCAPGRLRGRFEIGLSCVQLVEQSFGRAAFIAFGAQAPKPDRTDVTSLRPAVGRARAPLERIAKLVAAGAIRPPEIKLYRLSQAAEAHRVSESRHFRGKLVFQVR